MGGISMANANIFRFYPSIDNSESFVYNKIQDFSLNCIKVISISIKEMGLFVGKVLYLQQKKSFYCFLILQNFDL